MFQEFHPLHLSQTNNVRHLLRPEQMRSPISLHSPALDILTDFLDTSPVTVAQDMQIDDALDYMKRQHVRLLIAIDIGGQPAGIITAHDLMGSRVLAYMQQSGNTRDAVSVKQLMLPMEEARALTYQQVQGARIGDIMQTLSHSGDQHVLVVDSGLAGVERIRGIISASNISRALKIGFDVMYEAKTFAEIERMVTHGNRY